MFKVGNTIFIDKLKKINFLEKDFAYQITNDF